MKEKKNKITCCEKPDIQEGKIKYPLGLPLETIRLKYCSVCGKIHDVTW